jgi:hypothetical protein
MVAVFHLFGLRGKPSAFAIAKSCLIAQKVITVVGVVFLPGFCPMVSRDERFLHPETLRFGFGIVLKRKLAMKLIAFYLPQYHPIPENDLWWGKGFTDWTNVAKAIPLYRGHYQPHVPADLGFYDLRLEETRIAQATMAQKYGIHAFCYYHYWFIGKMLIERPFNEVLNSRKPEFPFCLCWANESWSRRWDGSEKEILMKQDYELYDPEEHMTWLTKAFSDPRYIRINDRPLFLIYRAGDIVRIADIVKQWRATAKKKGFADIYLCYIKNFPAYFTDQEFLEMGFNAILEFQPHPAANTPPMSIPGSYVYKYSDFVKRALSNPPKDYVDIPCVFPSWDNSARRKVDAGIIQNAEANLYKLWLKNSLQRVKDYPEEEQLVFINAWNEWAEGCHLEPDLKHGRRFLEATRNAVYEVREGIEDNAAGLLQDRLNDGHSKLMRSWLSYLKHISRKRLIYIWGAGDAGAKTAQQLLAQDIPIAGFIDSDEKKAGLRLAHGQVFGPSSLNDQVQDKHFVIVSSVYFDEISLLLERKGFQLYIDYLPDYQVPRRKLETSRRLKLPENRFARCNICGGEDFIPWTREGATDDYRCQLCGSLSPDRMMLRTLVQLHELPDWPMLSPNFNQSILETSGWRSYSYYLSSAKNYENIHYFAINKAHLEAHSLPSDNSQDMVISFERLDCPQNDLRDFEKFFMILKQSGRLYLSLCSDLKESDLFSNEALKKTYHDLSSLGFRLEVFQSNDSVHAINTQWMLICRKI